MRPNRQKKGCLGHWGVFLPFDYQGYRKYDVCVSLGNAADVSGNAFFFRCSVFAPCAHPTLILLAAYIMIHETMHLYVFRLLEAGKVSQREFESEDLADCLAKHYGAGMFNNLAGYGCSSAAHKSRAQELLRKYPPMKIDPHNVHAFA